MSSFNENTLNHVTNKIIWKMMDRVIIFRNIEGKKIKNLILSKQTNKEPRDLIRPVDVL